MQFVVYRDQKKIVVRNVLVPNYDNLKKLVNDFKGKSLDVEDLQLYNVRITATKGMVDEFDEEMKDDEVRREVREGIGWRQVTVN